MFIAATRKTGYDIAVHKSQTKTGGRQYGFQRKVKADKKERASRYLAIMTNYVGYISQNIRASLDLV